MIGTTTVMTYGKYKIAKFTLYIHFAKHSLLLMAHSPDHFAAVRPAYFRLFLSQSNVMCVV